MKDLMSCVLTMYVVLVCRHRLRMMFGGLASRLWWETDVPSSEKHISNQNDSVMWRASKKKMKKHVYVSPTRPICTFLARQRWQSYRPWGWRMKNPLGVCNFGACVADCWVFGVALMFWATFFSGEVNASLAWLMMQHTSMSNDPLIGYYY